MILTPRTCLCPYEITGSPGANGIGEVLRAGYTSRGANSWKDRM